MIDTQTDFAIAFAGEAGETFQKLLAQLRFFGVTITTQEGEVIEGVLIGPDSNSEWLDAVVVQPVTDDVYEYDAEAPKRSVRIGTVLVH